jgi:hypothetical protein
LSAYQAMFTSQASDPNAFQIIASKNNIGLIINRKARF